MTERELLERFVANHDEEAFRTLVERHGRMVLAVCQAVLADPCAVEDAFRKTFLALAGKAGTIRDADLLGPWLHRAALRAAKRSMAPAGLRRGRQRHAVRSRIEIEDDRNESISGPIPDDDLGCCPGRTVKGRLGRARERLRERWLHRGVGTGTRSWRSRGSSVHCTSPSP
jgi:DNA-directed RNA polymerase specialized sigma24 family protein